MVMFSFACALHTLVLQWNNMRNTVSPASNFWEQQITFGNRQTTFGNNK